MYIKCVCGNEDKLELDKFGGAKTLDGKFKIEVNCHTVKLEIKCNDCGKEFKEI